VRGQNREQSYELLVMMVNPGESHCGKAQSGGALKKSGWPLRLSIGISISTTTR
jgi:hypothetical protein